MRRKLTLFTMAFGTALLFTTFCSGQVTTGTISGTVVDKSGAVVPDARVTITNTEKGTSVVYTTNAKGYYSAPYLIPGTYQVSAEKAGFQRAVRSGIVLQVDQYQTMNFTLLVGRITQTVSVTSAPPLVEAHEFRGQLHQ
jgi:Carboxypeptidase regulatory-like domain